MTEARGRSPRAGGPAARARPATARARATVRAPALARALTVALAAVLVLAAVSAAAGALGACGGEGAGEKWVGSWRAADVALAVCTLVKVWQDGGAYFVRVDCEAPRPASAEGDVLHVMPAPELSSSPSPDPLLDPLLAFDLEVKSGRVVLRSRQGSSHPVEV